MPTAVSWMVGGKGESCMEACATVRGGLAHVCTGMAWPSSDEDFRSLLATADIKCDSIAPGSWQFNPVVFVGRSRKCYWMGEGSKDRCLGHGVGDSRRICPCQKAPLGTTLAAAAHATTITTTTAMS